MDPDYVKYQCDAGLIKETRKIKKKLALREKKRREH